MRVVVLVALAACSFPEKHPGIADAAPDAETPFGCVGLPFGTTAPAQIQISGTAADLGTGVVANDLVVMGMLDAGGSVFTQTTDATGSYSAVVETNHTAIAGYVVSTAGTYVPSYFYPSHPFDGNTTAPLPTLTAQELGTVGNPAGTALAQLILGDCVGTPLQGCTLAVTPTPMLVEYSINGHPDVTATATDNTGYVLVKGATPGTVTFDATCPTGQLRSTAIALVADSTYFIELEP